MEDQSKVLDKPAVKETLAEVEDEELNELLPPSEASGFRALAARANLAADRPDIGYAVKELCRDMAVPRRRSQIKLKRLGRYLLEYPRLARTYPSEQTEMNELHAYTTQTGRVASARGSRRAEG